MTTGPQALLLVGSGKPTGTSSSEALAGYLLERLEGLGFAPSKAYAHQVLRTERRTEAFLRQADEADLFILAFPLYVDTLPHLVTKALERIVAHRRSDAGPPSPRFLAIANCGFPEAEHNAVALAICREFAAEAGLEWAGGLAMGAGGAVSGRSLTAAGGLVRNVVRALDLTAAALAAGQPVPEEAVALMAKPLLPARLYTWIGGFGWRQLAWRNGVYRQLGAKPFGGE